MFRGGNFGRHFIISSLSYNVEHWVLNANAILTRNITFQIYFVHTSPWASVWLIYISTTSGHVTPVAHFNSCVSWLEIRVQATWVAISTFFYITHLHLGSHTHDRNLHEFTTLSDFPYYQHFHSVTEIILQICCVSKLYLVLRILLTCKQCRLRI